MTTIAPHANRAPTLAERTFLLAVFGLVPVAPVYDSALDWDFLLSYATEHLALPALGLGVSALKVPPAALPVSVRETLVDAAIHNDVQNRVLLADLAEAVGALKAEGIQSIALKGAGLLAQFPELVRTRHTDDIDLWVDPARVFDAERILRARGYGDLAHPDVPVSYDGRPVAEGTRVDGHPSSHHQLRGLVSERGTPLEIHRHPPAGDHVRWDEALRSGGQVSIRGVEVSVRDGRSMLRDLCTHVVLHHDALPVLWPRHLNDVTTLLSREPDLIRRAATGARVGDRVALGVTAMVLRQTRAPNGRAPLASRLVFPREARLGWAGYQLLRRLGQRAGRGPAAVAWALFPSESFLRARGFDPDAGRLRAHVAHARDVLSRATR